MGDRYTASTGFVGKWRVLGPNGVPVLVASHDEAWAKGAAWELNRLASENDDLRSALANARLAEEAALRREREAAAEARDRAVERDDALSENAKLLEAVTEAVAAFAPVEDVAREMHAWTDAMSEHGVVDDSMLCQSVQEGCAAAYVLPCHVRCAHMVYTRLCAIVARAALGEVTQDAL